MGHSKKMMATNRPTSSTSPLLLSSVALTACMGIIGTLMVAGNSKEHPNFVGRSMVAPTRAGFAARRATQNFYPSFVSRLITEQHFVRYNRKYEYNPVFALGVCSVFDQLFESYIGALSETPGTYRADQASLEEWAKS